jgi:hypothetical protein
MRKRRRPREHQKYPIKKRRRLPGRTELLDGGHDHKLKIDGSGETSFNAF